MKHTKLILTLIFVMGLGLLTSKAQHSVNTTGGNVSNTSGSVGYSVGQIVCSSYSENDGSVSEGVQQPYEIYVITSVDKMKDIDLIISVFPNPVADQLSLLVTGQENHPQSDYYYHLLDINGKSIILEKMIDDITLIDMSGMQPGVYFLQVTASEERIGLFKIIKR